MSRPDGSRPRLAPRPWLPACSADVVGSVSARTAGAATSEIDHWLHDLTEQNRLIHEVRAVNLNPAANTMNPRAEALLSAGLGTRPSLGHPGDKYEVGLEAIEQIEVIAAELAAEVFDADHVEVRVPSGAMANLFAFMAIARPGDAMIAPPATIAGHVTHHRAGAAGRYGLVIHEAPVDVAGYTIDVAGLADLARRVRPRIITTGQSLNLFHHPVEQIREVADAVGATVVFDAAHLSGLIAGRAWPNPLHRGAHVMTMSTYKSLAGPPAGLVMTDDAAIAERIEAVAFPGLTANFDAGATAALAMTLLDWRTLGDGYARTMTAAAAALSAALDRRGVGVHAAQRGATTSHAFALDARALRGSGAGGVERLRRANLLTSVIGLPSGEDAGIRIGTNEVCRWGADAGDMEELADLMAAALHGPPEAVASAVTAWRRRFTRVCHIRDVAGR
jgi:glycine hydroxymethyltransferase